MLPTLIGAVLCSKKEPERRFEANSNSMPCLYFLLLYEKIGSANCLALSSSRAPVSSRLHMLFVERVIQFVRRWMLRSQK